MDSAEKRLDDLYLYQPNRAVEAENDLGFAIEEYETFLEKVARTLRGGRRVLTPKAPRSSSARSRSTRAR